MINIKLNNDDLNLIIASLLTEFNSCKTVAKEQDVSNLIDELETQRENK